MTAKSVTTARKVTPRQGKAAAPKAETPTKARRAVTAKATPQTTHRASTFYTLIEGARPRAGAALMAHTHAALAFLRISAHAVSVKAAQALLGPRAVEHHTKIGNFLTVGTSMNITERGRDVFARREEDGLVNKELVAVYARVFSKGTPDPAHGIKPTDIHPVTMSLH